MSDETRLPAPRGDMTPMRLTELKKERTALRKRKRDLEGAMRYLGERVEQTLLAELESVSKRFAEIDKLIKTSDFQVGERYIATSRGLQVASPINSPTDVMDLVGDETADYVLLEELGTLEISYFGPALSLQNFCLFNLELNRLVNDVSHSLIEVFADPRLMNEKQYKDLMSRRRPRIGGRGYTYPWGEPWKPDSSIPLISTRINTIKIGSFYEVLSFAVLPILAHPDVRSVLMNLVSNVIWVLGGNLGTVIKGKIARPEMAVEQTDAWPYIRDIISARRGESIHIDFVHERPNQERMQVTIQVGNINPSLTATTIPTPPQLPSKSNS
jgi:hypothetical protein